MRRNSRINKMAQMSQAFTYISIILIIGVIAVVGAKAIFSVFKTDCDVKYQEFNSKINQFADSYTDKGSVKFETLTAPCDAKEVIFVSSSIVGTAGVTSEPVIESSVEDGSYNIFVLREFYEPVGLSAKINVDGGSGNPVLRIPFKNGNVRLKFTGEGRTTRIEQG